MFSCFLFALALVSLVNSGLSEFFEGLDALQFLCDLDWLLSQFLCRLSNHVFVGVLLLCISLLQSVSSSICNQSLLGLASFSWEKNQFALVGSKSLGVDLESFFRHILSSVIYSDANSLGKLSGESSILDFLECEASSISYLGAVFSSTAVD